MNNLDEMYNNRHEDLHHLSTEQKLILFQQNIERKTKENLQQQVGYNRSMKN